MSTTKLNPFQQKIKDYLDQRAAEDELFAVTYKKANKNLEDCCNYVIKCAKVGKRKGYADEEVYNWAVHYYDEDDLKKPAKVSCTVVINEAVELSESQKETARKEATEKLIDEEKKKVKLDFVVELSEEEKAEAKRIALDKLVDQERERMGKKKKKTVSKTQAVEIAAVSESKTVEENVQPGDLGSLFG